MPQISVKRVYGPPSSEDGFRVLVDRLWPRGLSREKAAVDHWAKDLAPSTELRRWYGHDPEKWTEFRKRYEAELSKRDGELRDLLRQCGKRRLTLLFGAKDTEHNQAHVLQDVLNRIQRGQAPR